MVKLVDNKASNFGHACSGYSIDDKEVTLHFENQADQTADVLIAVRSPCPARRVLILAPQNSLMESSRASESAFMNAKV